jgi:hypothetical protein
MATFRMPRGSDQEVIAMSATRLTGLYAVLAGAAAVFFSPLLALSYFATADGAHELEIGSVSAWADPARDMARGLLTWASADRVYSSYVQVFALLFPAVYLCARAMRARRSMRGGRLERWGWRLALAGYGLAAVGLAATFFVLLGGDPEAKALDPVFMALMVPGMLISIVGSTVLGIALLRAGDAPKLTAWLLALAIPLMILASDRLGHNSLGLVPLFIAWAAAGWQLWRVEPSHAQGLAMPRPH